jgi:formate hydrogenlyase transcriptional activator
LRPRSFSQADLDVLAEIAPQIAIAVENALAFSEIAELKDRLSHEKRYLETEIRTRYHSEQIIGESPAWQRVLEQAAIVAPTNSTVLLSGETGTGKELIAHAIHSQSPRRERTLVKINCAAMPTGLLESELFGHEKGAFTGALSRQIGRLELAHQGTLMLDEVGEMALELQPKLLRVLQEHEFERLGNPRTIKVDVRQIAATNRDLSQMVADRTFRQDLYYRLNVFPIVLPPLRERAGDVEAFVWYFVAKHAARMRKSINSVPSEAMEGLRRYSWPGNVRELEHFIERAVILTRGDVLEVPLEELRTGSEDRQVTTLAESEREHILRAHRASGGVIGGEQGAAARLKIKRTTLNSRMRKLGISRDDY